MAKPIEKSCAGQVLCVLWGMRGGGWVGVMMATVIHDPRPNPDQRVAPNYFGQYPAVARASVPCPSKTESSTRPGADCEWRR